MTVSRKGKEFSRRTKLDTWERAGGCCEKCRRKLYPGDRMVYDHRIPIEQGGDNSPENCQLLCGACDAPKTARDAATSAKSRAVRARHVGATTPKRKIPGSKGTGFRVRLTSSGPRAERE